MKYGCLQGYISVLKKFLFCVTTLKFEWKIYSFTYKGFFPFVSPFPCAISGTLLIEPKPQEPTKHQ